MGEKRKEINIATTTKERCSPSCILCTQNNVQNEVASMQIDVNKKNTSLIVSFCMIYGVNDDEDNKKQCDQQRQYPQRQHEMREK